MRIEDLLETHPGWNILLSSAPLSLAKWEILREAKECVEDSCISSEDFNIVKAYLNEL